MQGEQEPSRQVSTQFMELKKIEHVPEFKSDVPEIVRSKMSDGDGLLADALSIIRQQGEWSCRVSMEAYNLAVENNLWKQKFESPLNILVAIIGVLFTAGVGALFSKWLK